MLSMAMQSAIDARLLFLPSLDMLFLFKTYSLPQNQLSCNIFCSEDIGDVPDWVAGDEGPWKSISKWKSSLECKNNSFKGSMLSSQDLRNQNRTWSEKSYLLQSCCLDSSWKALSKLTKLSRVDQTTAGSLEDNHCPTCWNLVTCTTTEKQTYLATTENAKDTTSS